jgi:hypothetical protein
MAPYQAALARAAEKELLALDAPLARLGSSAQA